MGNDMFNDEQLAHAEILQKETEDALGFWKDRALKAEAALAALSRARETEDGASSTLVPERPGDSPSRCGLAFGQCRYQRRAAAESCALLSTPTPGLDMTQVLFPGSRPKPKPQTEDGAVREAAEVRKHRTTLLSGLAYIARESWWPDDASVTDGVRDHVGKMRDAVDALSTPAPAPSAKETPNG